MHHPLVECIPLYSMLLGKTIKLKDCILISAFSCPLFISSFKSRDLIVFLAIGKTQVDFFSLDIEGADLLVLKTIPWDKVNIKLVMIEVAHSDVNAIITVMYNAGYTEFRRTEYDIIFEKK